MKKVIQVFLILYSLSAYSQSDIVGIYKSRKHTTTEKFKIMHLRGYFNFVYPSLKQPRTITVYKDSTFNYVAVKNPCNGGLKGTWSVKNKKLSLLFDADGTKDIFHIKDNIIYEIYKTEKNNKERTALLLLEKVNEN